MTSVYKPRFGIGSIMPDQCAAGVHEGHHYYQCSRKWSVEEDGHRWCKQHAPSAQAARDKAWRAKYDADMAARDRLLDKADAWTRIAQTAVALFKQQATMDDLEKAVTEYERLAND